MFFLLLIKKAIYFSLGLNKRHSSYRRSLQQRKASSTSKTEIY